MRVIYLTVALILAPLIIECARTCYSGTNNNYKEKICDTGATGKTTFVCQKFTCEGGKSPFVLRTCANTKTGCLAGPAVCRFSGGTGSCARCETNNCNV
uniref:Uncharacterized protein n=1 Tax=Parascaris univalens TaxID=6257 RepID=A0A915BBV7_PARUN